MSNVKTKKHNKFATCSFLDKILDIILELVECSYQET